MSIFPQLSIDSYVFDPYKSIVEIQGKSQHIEEIPEEQFDFLGIRTIEDSSTSPTHQSTKVKYMNRIFSTKNEQ